VTSSLRVLLHKNRLLPAWARASRRVLDKSFGGVMAGTGFHAARLACVLPHELGRAPVAV